MAEHPSIKQFRTHLQNKAVLPEQAAQFDKWRNGPKCTGEHKEAADSLWEEYQKVKDQVTKRPVATSIQTSRRADDRGRQPSRGRGGQGGRGGRDGGHGGRGGRDGRRGGHGGGGGPNRVTNVGAAEPDVLGEPFHNPYTFIPFAQKPPIRRAPTPLTIDEVEKSRFTGILDLEVELLSPLLTADPTPHKEDRGHREHTVLAVGDDVIVPATGVRGVLRSLLSVLTGGTLGHIDEEAWLCQGRDAKLGPASKFNKGLPAHVFLAEVVVPGKVNRDGVVRVGKTRLVKAQDLERAAQRSGINHLPRPRPGDRVKHLWANEGAARVGRNSDAGSWKVKLSGRPVNPKGKREGLLNLEKAHEVSLPATLWSAFHGRHRHADHPELKKGDLVWLEPRELGCTEIRQSQDVKSIQWARWGRAGERLLNAVAMHHRGVLPDELNPDGLVDEVTDLFGQVPRNDLKREVRGFEQVSDKQNPAGPFAARVRPGNLVFPAASKRVERTALAPLAPPHPGCAAFYRDMGERDVARAADDISNEPKKLPLRGYKVYRTTSERGKGAPWRFEVQGVYDDKGKPKPAQQKVNKTVELLPEKGAPRGRLRLTLRAMTQREVALVLAACAVDWRVGGGKPLGLGHCRVASASLRELRDDGTTGDPVSFARNGDDVAELPLPYAAEIRNDEQLSERMRVWQASQQPVSKLRYPRAVDQNRNKKNRGGHVWFLRHAQPKKSGDNDYPQGLQVLHVDPNSALGNQAQKDRIRAQPLPKFDPNNPAADVLYGHDLFVGEGDEWRQQSKDRRTLHRCVEPFDPEKHSRAEDRSGGHQGQSAETRQQGRDARSSADRGKPKAKRGKRKR